MGKGPHINVIPSKQERRHIGQVQEAMVRLVSRIEGVAPAQAAVLKDHSYFTLGDIILRTEPEELSEIEGIGEKTVTAIKRVISTLNLTREEIFSISRGQFRLENRYERFPNRRRRLVKRVPVHV